MFRATDSVSSGQAVPSQDPPGRQLHSKLITPFQFASQTCDNFKISKLSGIGMQLSSTKADPDRACKVACQDRDFSYRFYMVSGEKGWFPYGTDCSRGLGTKDSFCVKVGLC